MSSIDKPSASKAPAAIDTRAVQPLPRWRRLLATRAAFVLLLDLVLIAFFTLLSENFVFFSLANFQSMLLNGTGITLLALGLSMLLGAGEFDLSLGANLVLSSVVGASVMVAVGGSQPIALTIFLGLVACVIAGMLFGWVNGLLIAYGGINSLIVTLGTMGIGQGLALLLSNNGQDITGFPVQLQSGFGLNTIAWLPAPAVVALLIAALLWAIVTYTRFGRHTLAIGSSRVAADRAGLRIKPHLLKLTMLAGGMAGLAAFVDLAHYQTTVISGHPNDALLAVTAAVIGGTLLEGGRISIFGTLCGVALIMILRNGLVIAGVYSSYQLVAIGAVLIIAVGLDRLATYRRSTAR
jgi:ribose transport system permease protein